MPWSPTHVTIGVHDEAGNHWLEAGNSQNPLVVETKSELEATNSKGSLYHARSQTTPGHPLYSLSYDDVPIFRRRSSVDLHATRPSLRRAVGAARNTFEEERHDIIDGEYSQKVDKRCSKKQVETEVIVHQIQPGDSLPGVALKYNISLAALRTANKLWANDSIHLREILYIPIQAIATDKAKAILSSFRACPEVLSYSPNPAPEGNTRTQSDPSAWIVDTNSKTAGKRVSAARTIPAGSTSTIRRVPLSELSFFPPSPSTHSSPKHHYFHSQALKPSSSFLKSSTAIMPPSSSPNASTRGTSTFGLPSFLHGAKDEIISRLSFDSTRGSSDTGEENDLELDVVRPGGIGRQRTLSSDDDSEQNDEFMLRSNGTAIKMHAVAQNHGVVLDTPRKLKVIRTTQLEPSPEMVIPAS